MTRTPSRRPFDRLLSLLPGARLVLLVLLSAVAPLAAQDLPRVLFEASFAPAAAKPGDEVVLRVQAEIEDGYHIYGRDDPTEPVRFAFQPPGGLEAVGDPVIPVGTAHTAFGVTNYWLVGTHTLEQRFRVTAAAAAGTLRVPITVRYMACTEEFCDPPTKERLTANLEIEGGAPQAKEQGPGKDAGAGATTPTAAPGFGGLAGFGAEEERVAFELRFEPATAQPGDEVVLVIDAEIEDGYHIYGRDDPTEPTRLDFPGLTGLEPIGDADIPIGTEHSAFGVTNWWLKGTQQFRQRFRVTDAAPNGVLRVPVLVRYMACTEQFCDPVSKARQTARLEITGSTATGNPTSGDPAEGGGETGPATRPDPGTATGPVTLRQPRMTIEGVAGEGIGGSLWSLILLCIGGGLIALVMPCTYPMIPITFSFFTKQADARGGRVLPLALTYGAGIVLIFVVIGVAVGEVITVFAAHWITNLVIGAAFVLFALSLFGFIILQPPQFVNRIAGQAGKSGGLLGVFLMGATLVITSFTCTAPIVGSLLASVADVGRGRIAFGMAVFGLTMAAPFVALALLPGRVKALPKSGEWMNTLKVSLGFVELAAALKFFSNVDVALGLEVMPREAFLMTWAFTFALLALFLFGLFAYRGAPVEGVSAKRNTFGVLSLGFAFYCLFGTMGFQLDPVMTAFEPPYRLRAHEEHPIVYDDYPAALAQAQQDERWLLINFTGFT
ncbi:MAG: cytochrome c biogenesis protein CcdA [Planctomycetota bacterium]